ncbi:MAG: glutamine-hydrolyzing carbamoyl-phosphate synthase small subunit [Chitinophagales bacterium]
MESKNALLILEDGTIFNGKAAGAIGTASGEICFNTGMTGYQEIFTDPSYYKQVMLLTADHIGNYGINYEEVESDSIKIAALVCKNFSGKVYSRKNGDCSIQEYFEKEGLVAICNVDTRALVRHIRNKGAMNCIISSETDNIDALKAQLKKVPSMEGLELASEVSTKEPYFYGVENSEKRVAVIDFGIKKNILRCLAERGVYMKVFPANTDFETIEEWAPHAYFLSNGPGDPAPMDYAVKTAQKIIESGKPTFGICLGHQILALANNVKTFKMFNGHRGINHPVQHLESKLCEITSQNHGFAVEKNSLEHNDALEITHLHLNDNTVAGLKMKGKPVFSVQYHPEASPGPEDSRYLFDQFVELLN